MTALFMKNIYFLIILFLYKSYMAASNGLLDVTVNQVTVRTASQVTELAQRRIGNIFSWDQLQLDGILGCGESIISQLQWDLGGQEMCHK